MRVMPEKTIAYDHQITAKQARETAEKTEAALYNIILDKIYGDIAVAANEGKFFVTAVCDCPSNISDMIISELRSNGFAATPAPQKGKCLSIKW
jgi:hypothetical protein